MIRGAIDGVDHLPDGRVKLVGWALETRSGLNKPTEGFTFTGDGYSLTRESRSDYPALGEVGFKLTLEQVGTLAGLYFGALDFRAFSGSDSKRIEILSKLEEKIVQIICTYTFSRFSKENIHKFFRSALSSHSHKPQKSTTRMYSEFLLEVGSTSFDGEVAVGRDGFLFLIGGSNFVHKQYTSPLDLNRFEAWATLIRSRHDFCSKNEIAFIQMIIPEKQSVLHEYIDYSINTPTALLEALNSEFVNSNFYLDCYQSLKAVFEGKGLLPFRKVDTHLSFFGVARIVQDILALMGLKIDILPEVLEEAVITGDLANKLFEGNVMEKSLLPNLQNWDFANTKPIVVQSRIPERGNVSTMYHWRCAEPCVDKKILIFGNSMFERGGGPLCISWWVNRIFRETLFVWSPRLDRAQVEDFKPDIVVCQTVERFLPGLPNA